MSKCARSSGVFLLLVLLIGFPLVIRLEAVGGPRAAPEREAREKWAERYDRPEEERVFRDYWVTPPDGPEGGTYQHVTIPFGFFGPECDGFERRVHFVGSPLDPGTTGNADTVLERSADPVSARDAEGTTGTVTLRLTELSLVSKDPIAVECNDGLSLWHVHVGLSSEAPWAGWMTATKTHGDGGTFDSMIYVQPLLTFTNVDDPDDVLVFDTADVSDPAELAAAEVPFVLRVEASIARDDPDSVSGENVPSEFIPGIESPTDSQRRMDDPDYRRPWPRQVQPRTPLVVHQAPGHQHCVEPPTGACCDDEGGCTVTSEADCLDAGHAYMTGTPTCSDSTCEGDFIPVGDDWFLTVPEDTYDTVDLPAGFFGEGSDAIPDTTIAFEHDESYVHDDRDTCIRRLRAVVLPFAVNSEVSTRIQITEVALQSQQPIEVTFNGGAYSRLFNVRARLSFSAQPEGYMTIQRGCEGGGVYEATLPILAKLIFTEVGHPENEYVLDAGVGGMPPLNLSGANEVWSRDPAVQDPPGNGFYPTCDGCASQRRRNVSLESPSERYDRAQACIDLRSSHVAGGLCH